MMHQPLIARLNLDSFEPASVVDRNVQDEIPISVRSTRGKKEWFLSVEHEVWFAQIPALRKFGFARQVSGIAFDCALLDPVLDESDLLVGEVEIVGEFQLSRLRQPGRHQSRAGDDGDLLGMFFGVLVSQERKRSGLACVMASGTALENDWCDVAVESDCTLFL